MIRRRRRNGTALEKLRDPSHVRCLTLPELKGLFGAAGFREPRASFYELRDEVQEPAGAVRSRTRATT